MGKEIIINHMEQEIRVAVKESQLLTEIHYERAKDKSPVGNIYKGKVLKVLPGMESAFVDIGLPKAAFLYVDDIRTDTVDIDSDDSESPSDQQKQSDSRKKLGKSKKNNISALLKEGQDILVQVSKGPIGTKGARVTCNISLPGRNLVFMPHVHNVGVSRQITDDKERSRLKQIVGRAKPNNTGFIVRTVAAGRSEDEFRSDIDYLLTTWKEIESQFQGQKSPACLYEDLNLTFRTMRDMLSHEIKQITIDDPREYDRIKQYLQNYLPKYVNHLKLYNKHEDIFNYYGINVEIARAIGRKVWLKSGGYLIIDQSEALTAIDVNTGRFTGSDNHEDTIVQTNLESAVELVYQLKLRDIGGIIIIDFIDMESVEHRHKVFQVLKEELKKDKARSKILAISEIGLVEMTRKRSRENLDRFLCMPCPYCNGTARILSPTTTFHEIFREISRIAKTPNAPKNLLLTLHPDLGEYIENEELKSFRALEKMLNGTITIKTSEKFHLEQYEVFEL